MEVEKLIGVGDQVTIEGHDGVFFVLASSDAWQTVSLLAPNGGKCLDSIPVSNLTLFKRPGPNGATQS